MSHHPTETAATFAARAIGLAMDNGIPCAIDTACCLCGVALPMGSPSIKATKAWFGSGFVDGRRLYPLDSRWACPACDALGAKKILSSFAIAVYVSQEGVFSIAPRAAHRTFLLSPPEPPFAYMVQSAANAQHLIWSTPLTRSKDHIYMRYGPQNLFLIRRKLVLEAADAVGRLLRIFANPPPDEEPEEVQAEDQDEGKPSKAKKPKKASKAKKAAPRVVFSNMVWEHRADLIGEDGHGVLSQRARKYGSPQDLELLEALNPGEVYALGMVTRDSKPDEVTQPIKKVYDTELLATPTN